MTDSAFLRAFSRKLLAACYEVETHESEYRLPVRGLVRTGTALLRRLGGRLARMARRLGFAYVPFTAVDPAGEALAPLLAHLDDLYLLYEALADEASREALVALLAYRVLGRRRVRLPFADGRFWDALRLAKGPRLRGPGRLYVEHQEVPLNLYDLRGLPVPVRLYATWPTILHTFLVEHYRYARGPVSVQVERGDTVVDGGGCWGDTALYFAHQAGEDGRVFTFEFLPANLSALHDNLEMNPSLKDRVTVVREALWDTSGQRMACVPGGDATRLAGELQDGAGAVTTSLDDFVERQGVERVDFIKLDIEGSELAALRGAERTLRRFRPKLAVAVYHRAEDYFTIPQYLLRLGLGYRHFLNNCGTEPLDTVLFARAD